MIDLNTRVIARGRYLGTIHDAVEVKKDGHRTWAYQVEYRHGLPKLRGWFLARDIETSNERKV